MSKLTDYSNTRIGKVQIISLYSKKGHSRWNCQCDCGNKFIGWSITFKRGEKFDCKKCVSERRRCADLSGKKFGRWTVLRRGFDKSNNSIWFCRCECGVERYVPYIGKKAGSQSCGCLRRKDTIKHT